MSPRMYSQPASWRRDVQHDTWIHALDIEQWQRNCVDLLVCTCITTKYIQYPPGVLKRLAAVIALNETDHLGSDLALVLQTADLQARKQAEHRLRLRIDQLLLHKLERRKRPSELLTLQGILPCSGDTVFQGPNGSPGNTEPGIVEAAEWRT